MQQIVGIREQKTIVFLILQAYFIVDMSQQTKVIEMAERKITGIDYQIVSYTELFRFPQ